MLQLGLPHIIAYSNSTMFSNSSAANNERLFEWGNVQKQRPDFLES